MYEEIRAMTRVVAGLVVAVPPATLDAPQLPLWVQFESPK